MADHNEFGKMAEEKAARFLKEQGFKILKRNWHFHKSEIDIIAEKEGNLHIVEVKARKNKIFISPEDAVDKRKRGHLLEAANAFAEDWEGEGDVIFDIISITKDPEWELEFLEDAFESID